MAFLIKKIMEKQKIYEVIEGFHPLKFYLGEYEGQWIRKGVGYVFVTKTGVEFSGSKYYFI